MTSLGNEESASSISLQHYVQQDVTSLSNSSSGGSTGTSSSIFLECTEACGYVAAVIAVVSFGSFGVPVRMTAKNHDAHPLVMQSYKTFVCFATCWLVVLLGEEVWFTPYGILSGLFWVPGATCGIYGIRYAGLAISVGTWSSIIVLSSFVIGIVIFKEKVKSFFGAAMAFCFLIVGLTGMSRYSSSSTTTTTTPTSSTAHEKTTKASEIEMLLMNDKDTPSSFRIKQKHPSFVDSSLESYNNESMVDIDIHDNNSGITNGRDDDEGRRKEHVVLFGGRISLSLRQIGIIGAIINGVWGGMNLIPLHFAKKDNPGLTGAGYIISYATGSMIIQLLMWIAWFGYNVVFKTRGDLFEAALLLPKWNADLIVPGTIAGLLYSIGNFSSIIAVSYLGQGTGFSFVQMSLFVSGLWGILYFKEISDPQAISKWFLSACIAVIGIIWLSYEHEGSAHR